MISEIDLLRDDIPRLEQKFGRGNPFVEVLKAHLTTLQNTQGLPPEARPYPGITHFKRPQRKKRHSALKKPH